MFGRGFGPTSERNALSSSLVESGVGCRVGEGLAVAVGEHPTTVEGQGDKFKLCPSANSLAARGSRGLAPTVQLTGIGGTTIVQSTDQPRPSAVNRAGGETAHPASAA